MINTVIFYNFAELIILYMVSVHYELRKKKLDNIMNVAAFL